MGFSQLLERENAIGILLASVKDASQGRGRVVVVEGEPGIGKTTLLQSFCQLAGTDCDIHWGWNDPLTTPRPLGALHDMATTLNPKIGEMLSRSASVDLIFSTLLGELMQSQIAAVLIVEDLQWADDATLDLIRFLGRRVSLLRAVIVLTFRNSDVDRDHPAIHVLGDLPSNAVTRLSIEPLSRQALSALAGSPEKGEALFRTTGGNPFFAMELLAEDNPVDGRLPNSIRDAVWARWARLPKQMRDFLNVISIIPGGAHPSMISFMGEDSEQIADQCVERGLLYWGDRNFLVFRHELARQATLERLSPATQRSLNRQIEEVLANLPRSQDDPDILSQRVHHAVSSGNAMRVLELAPQAAAQAAALGAHRQAARHLATALDHVAFAPASSAAQLYEDWAHETFLAGSVSSSETMRAYNYAITLWRSQGDIRKVGLNLCRLARLHWRQGEPDKAVYYTQQAVEELEAIPQPGKELALAYSTRSQLLMLQDRFDEAVKWGNRAIALSNRLGEIETRIHALNNVGTAIRFSGKAGGDELLEESLSLSLQHGFHDHASRAYTNLSESLMMSRDFAAADRLMTEGIAFCARYDLDTAGHYLLGRHAQLRMEQGRFQEARTIASGVIAKDGVPRVMHLPALTVLARVNTRLGLPDGPHLLREALDQGQSTGEPQRIVPVRLALLEAAWLSDRDDEAVEHVEALVSMGTDQLSAWDLGELLVGTRRCAVAVNIHSMVPPLPPRAAELDGDFQTAADMWLALEQPYESALALLQITGDGMKLALPRAIIMLEELEARPATEFARRKAIRNGLSNGLPRRRRGPYAAARQHPLGLTLSEQKILALMVAGLGNREISLKLGRSQRTIEHQVSSVLGKFNAENRLQVLLRTRSEPWLFQTELA